MMSFVANLAIESLDRASAVYVEDVVGRSRVAYGENGGDDDDTGYDYAPAAESCVGGDTTSYDQEMKCRQAAYAENGDQDDDDIYDYAPAA
ncbi:unnamed protein product [Arabidopsis arenosa]|uniref:Uncharacterized protein n=1 Tax=Arabidopsis arenosa TaxID=38785 RepID=A0A8S1ZQ43_ARAAE|nr:unnamed protein product [Arabidopsis arenosa]